MKGKMNINLNNYEAYFLDCHEGRLSAAMVKELMEFIELHPELKEEFESFEPITLNDSNEISYDEKDILKKTLTGISSSNFDEHAVEYIEGTLPAALQTELEAFITQNPHYQKELELYGKTKLAPDTSIIFEDKILLKKGRRRPAVFYYWSAAASVAIIIGAYFLLNKSETPAGSNIAKQNQVTDSNAVARHSIKQVDTAKITPKANPNIPIIRTVKNIQLAAINKHVPKPDTNEKVVQQHALQKDTATVAVNKATPDEHDVPVKKENPVPVDSGSNSVALNGDDNDGWQVIQRPKKKKKEKPLAQIASFTCKGLHTITGQHIELEKHYSSDTTNIVAYQLELGNKTFTFPVKE